jgi:hypothetical protein
MDANSGWLIQHSINIDGCHLWLTDTEFQKYLQISPLVVWNTIQVVVMDANSGLLIQYYDNVD